MNTTTATTPCPRCNDRKLVYGGSECSTGYYPCPTCQPRPVPPPEWMNPMGYDERIIGDNDGWTFSEQ